LARLDEQNSEHGAALVVARTTLGKALLAQGRVDEALPVLEAAVERAPGQFGKGHWRAADAELSYGRALLASGRVAEAEPLLRSVHVNLHRQRRAQPRLAAQAAAAIAKLDTVHRP
jgi:thioredoxin-like negative regulator of GroEL